VCTAADAWKLIVAGGMGSSSDMIPPRRTGTVTATRLWAAMCLAFQLPAATTTNIRRLSTAYTTPLERGSRLG
jgi:hypothetical protein